MTAAGTAWHEQYPTGVPTGWRRHPSYSQVALNTLGSRRWMVGLTLFTFGCGWAMKGGHPWALAKYSLFTSTAIWLVDLANRRRVFCAERSEFVRKTHEVRTAIDAHRTGLAEIFNEETSAEDRARAFDHLHENGGEELIRLLRDAPGDLAHLIDVAAANKDFVGWDVWFAPNEEIPVADRRAELAADRASDLMRKLAPHCQTVQVEVPITPPPLARVIDTPENRIRRDVPDAEWIDEHQMNDLTAFTASYVELDNQLYSLDCAIYNAAGGGGPLRRDHAESRHRDLLALLLLFGPTTYWVIT